MMPIDYRVNHDQRRVIAEGRGAVTAEEIFRYQREAWARADVAGYDELVDMTDVREIVEPKADEMRALAQMSAGMDAPGGAGRFAIVAPGDFAYGLGRMYEAFRDMTPGTRKEVSVFRDRATALAWLSGSDPMPGAAVRDPGRREPRTRAP
jgi:hypothetical protein